MMERSTEFLDPQEDVLMIADPRAIQHIFQTSAYRYPKRIDLVHLSRLVMGRGILAADGHDHPRHRKVMSPAFSTASLRSFLPIFRSHASKVSHSLHPCEPIPLNAHFQILRQLSEKFRGQCHEGPVNVAHWLSRTTLDIVGSGKHTSPSLDLLTKTRSLTPTSIQHPLITILVLWKIKRMSS